MITFGVSEIFASMLYACIYGFLFSSIYSFITALFSSFKFLPKKISNIFHKPRLFSSLKTDRTIIENNPCGTSIACFVIIFALGYVFLSYFALDGLIRLYMLVIAFASFYLSKFVFFGIFTFVFFAVSDILVLITAYVLRIISWPFVIFYMKFEKKNKEKASKF